MSGRHWRWDDGAYWADMREIAANTDWRQATRRQELAGKAAWASDRRRRRA